jgi:hypothetical protein
MPVIKNHYLKENNQVSLRELRTQTPTGGLPSSEPSKVYISPTYFYLASPLINTKKDE